MRYERLSLPSRLSRGRRRFSSARGFAPILALGISTLGVASIPTSARAASLQVTSTPGTLNTTAGITGFATDGDLMVGMTITATFNDGSSEKVTWAATSTIAGRALGTGWQITESGDTFGGDWVLTNASALPITRLLFDGAPGRTLFDISQGIEGTPNSANGQPFTVIGGGAALDIRVVYSEILAVGSNPPAGDLYRTMSVEFVAPGGPVGPGAQSLVWETDTDNATSDVVPEPSGALAVAALAAAALRRRNRRREPGQL